MTVWWMPSTSTSTIEKPVELHSPAQLGSQSYFCLQGAYKSFDAQKVLEGVTFRVFPGETVSLLGRSGAASQYVCAFCGEFHVRRESKLA
jgi:ABC-type transport system involved in cytochrome bd biosynthesis fused ATPase/permease subunit